MKKSVTPILVVASAIALVCTAVFYSLVAGKLASGAQANNVATVVVAARNLPRGTAVGVLDVKAAPWSGGPVPEGAYRAATQVDGLITLADIAAGDPLVETRLASRRNGGGLGIPSGMRAISVQVHDSSGVVAMLRPGHRVDVQAVYTRTGSHQDAELKTVLENIEVLRINSTPEPGPGKPSFPVATLLVTPAEADVAGLADAVAKVRLVLRNPLDQERVNQRGSLGLGSVLRSNSGMALPRPAGQQPVAIASSAPRPPAGGGLSLSSATAAVASCNPPKAETASTGSATAAPAAAQ